MSADLALSSLGRQRVHTWECSLFFTPTHSKTLRASHASPREGPPSSSLVVPAPEQEAVRGETQGVQRMRQVDA